MREATEELDLDQMLQRGESPLALVQERVQALAPGEHLVLKVAFEPFPLYAHLAAWGARHRVEPIGGGFRIIVERLAAPVAIPRFLDLRGLPPPEPMQRTLAAFAALPEGGCLIVHLPHRPLPLLELLDDRAIPWEAQEQVDGTYHIYLLKEG